MCKIEKQDKLKYRLFTNKNFDLEFQKYIIKNTLKAKLIKQTVKQLIKGLIKDVKILMKDK